MKRIKHFLCLLAALAGFASCNGPMTSDEIMESCGSGVVMVVNQYYYQLKLPTGKLWYFTGFDEDGDLENWTTDKDEIMKSRKMLTGTGFFISSDGKIITNRHVASPDIKLSDTKKSVHQLLDAMATLVTHKMQQMSDRYDELENEKKACYSYDPYDGSISVDRDKLQEIEDEQSSLRETFHSDSELRDNIKQLDLSELQVETACELGIAYNDTYVTNTSDLVPCVVTSVSDKENVDLAQLQLKSKSTPSNRHIFNIDSKQDDKGFMDKVRGIFSSSDNELKTEQKLYMIGFNAGFSLSNTSQGIKAQITSGAVSQKSDNNKIMYTIPSLPGSSGSPVVDEYGHLVAVNFAGVTNTQSFNYGIVLERVKAFVNDH